MNVNDNINDDIFIKTYGHVDKRDPLVRTYDIAGKIRVFVHRRRHVHFKYSISEIQAYKNLDGIYDAFTKREFVDLTLCDRDIFHTRNQYYYNLIKDYHCTKLKEMNSSTITYVFFILFGMSKLYVPFSIRVEQIVEEERVKGGVFRKRKTEAKNVSDGGNSTDKMKNFSFFEKILNIFQIKKK